jgi:hypothetical protein
MRGWWTGDELRSRPVCLRGIQLGRIVELLVDPEGLRLIGFDVRCGDDATRFLPVSAARIRDRELEVRSALLLLDEHDTSFYRRRTRPLRELRDLPVRAEGGLAGPLRDVVVEEDGGISALVIDGGRRLPTGPSVRLDDRASAA